jgi:hypothetical protein
MSTVHSNRLENAAIRHGSTLAVAILSYAHKAAGTTIPSRREVSLDVSVVSTVNYILEVWYPCLRNGNPRDDHYVAYTSEALFPVLWPSLPAARTVAVWIRLSSRFLTLRLRFLCLPGSSAARGCTIGW